MSSQEELEVALSDDTKTNIIMTNGFDIVDTVVIDRQVEIDGQDNTLTSRAKSTGGLLQVTSNAKDVIIKNLKLEGGVAGVELRGDLKLEKVTIIDSILAGVIIRDEGNLTIDTESKMVSLDNTAFINVKSLDESLVKGDKDRLFKVLDSENSEINYHMEEVIVEPEEPEVPVEPTYHNGELISFREEDGTDEVINPYGAFKAKFSLGKIDEKEVKTSDLEELEVSLKKSNSILATNKLVLDEIEDTDTLMSVFSFGRDKELNSGKWIEGAYKIQGETPSEVDLPNILFVSLQLKDNKKHSFSIKLEEVKLPLPYEKESEPEAKEEEEEVDTETENDL